MAVLVLVAGRLGDHAGQVAVATSGHADVEVLGASGPVDHQDPLVDGEPLSFVNGHRVGQGHVLLDVNAGEGDGASPVERGQLERSVAALVLDVPAVAVSDPGAGGGDQAPVVAGDDDHRPRRWSGGLGRSRGVRLG